MNEARNEKNGVDHFVIIISIQQLIEQTQFSNRETGLLRASGGCRSPCASGKNFRMVVNTTPPDSTASRARRSARLAACTGGRRSRSADWSVQWIVAIGWKRFDIRR